MIPGGRRPHLFHGSRLFFAPAWRNKLEDIGLLMGTDWRTLSPGRQITGAPITNCFQVVLDSGETVYFKRYVYKYRLISNRFYWLLPSKAAIESWGYQKLNSLGLIVPQVLALGEMRTFGLIRAACIVTLGLENSMDLETFAEEVWRFMPEPNKTEFVTEFSNQLIAQVQVAHAANFFHHDLKWRNILVVNSGSRYTPVWIDCPRAAVMRLRRRRGMIVDLSGLSRLAMKYFTPRQLFLFVCRYLGDQGDKDSCRRLFRDVEAHLSRRLPQHTIEKKQ